MSSKIPELQADISSKRSVLSTLVSLTEHAGWPLLAKIIFDQKNGRIGQVLFQPLESMDKVLTQEFTKGEISGLALTEVSVFAHIEALKHEVQVLESQLENENELQKRVADESGGSRVDGGSFGGDEPGGG